MDLSEGLVAVGVAGVVGCLTDPFWGFLALAVLGFLTMLEQMR